MTTAHLWGSMTRSMKAVTRIEAKRKPRMGRRKAMTQRATRMERIRRVAAPSGQNFSRGLEGGLPRPETSSRRPERPIRIPARKGMKPATGPEAASQIFSRRDSRQIPTARRIQTTW